MLYTTSTAVLAAVLAFTGAVDALPPRIGTTVTPGSNSNTFSVKQVRNSKHRGHSGPLALARTYLKYGATVPDDLSGAVDRIHTKLFGGARRTTGSAVNTPTTFDTEYLTPVSIGTPAQTLNLDFDTGSSDLWVYSSATPKSSIKGQSIYSPGKSSTSKQIKGATWNITYGDGSSSSGTVYTDKVTVGGLTVAKQAVEAATKVSAQFTADVDNDGLLGLAFSTINTVKPTQQTTFFDSAKSNLDAPIFAVDLKAGQPGTYDFGFINDDLHTGPISYAAVDSSQGFWSFTPDSYTIGTTTSPGFAGIADTGTTLMLLPTDVVTAYYAGVPGAKLDNTQGGYTFACSSTLPDFAFAVGSTTITVPGSYMNFEAVDSTNSTCFGGIQDDAGIGFAIFGDVALKAAYVVFDGTAGKEQLGWATKAL